MSTHSYSRLWIHLVWGTLERRPLLQPPAAARVSAFLTEYASKAQVYMKINYVNADHVHALIDLPTSMSVEEVTRLFKGASSHWINESLLVPGRFAWGRGYGVFSVSESATSAVARYISEQEEHHRRRSFAEELKLFLKRHQLRWRED